LQLNPAFARIKDPRVKRRLIGLVNALANLEQSDEPQVPRRGRKPKVFDKQNASARFGLTK
jgi:hypothetical protein